MADENNLPELRVLVIDDDVDAASSLAYVLQFLHCKTAVAFGASMGLRVAQLFQPTLVFVDFSMPDLNGCDLVTALKAQDTSSSTLMFVCLTGRSYLTDERTCFEAGFERFIEKPMEPGVLQSVLAEARMKLAIRAQAGGDRSKASTAATRAPERQPPDPAV